jgi:hypothetical protein
MLGTASPSALSYENSFFYPTIALWNDIHHVLLSNGLRRSQTRKHEPLATER